MTKKSKTPKRRYRHTKRFSRRKDKRMPFSMITGLATSVIAPPVPGWTSVLDAVKTGQFDKAAQSFVAGWTGVKLGGIGGQQNTEIEVGRLINPMDMSYAPALKTTLITAIAAKVAKKFIGDPFGKIPIVNKYIKFS